jgi:hypothetical protein
MHVSTFFFWEGVRQISAVLEILCAFPKFIQENVDISYVQLAWAVNYVCTTNVPLMNVN